ncbi:hypothetical protein B0H13DRAFT_2667458 [Mycena leptocephala]|nr:hypothetical protein B0H13DRAFT_2667458 [Mycena leptocephala]
MFSNPRSGSSSSHAYVAGPSSAPSATNNNNGAIAPRPTAPQGQIHAASHIGRKILAYCAPLPPPQTPAPVPASPPQLKWANPGQQEDWMTPLPLPPRDRRPAMPKGPLDPCDS